MGQDDASLVRRKRDDRPGLAARVPPPRELEAQAWPNTRPINYEQPAHVPVRPQGNVPCIVHLVWSTHEELVPGRAIRWTDTHVMVLVKPVDGPSEANEDIVWVRARDVHRTIPRR